MEVVEYCGHVTTIAGLEVDLQSDLRNGGQSEAREHQEQRKQPTR